MKRKMRNKLMIFAVVAMVMASCSPIYKCGDPIPDKKITGSKRLKSAINERDSLCTTLAMRDSEISGLKDNISSQRSKISELEKQYSDLDSRYNTLDKQYKDLSSANLSQSEQFGTALRQKSDELLAKEKLLLEREKALADLQRIVARQDSITRRLNDVLRNALLGFNSDELSVEIKNGKVYVSMSDKLLFKSGSAAVEAKGKQAIKLLADVLEKNPDIDILIEGHTDNVPIRTGVYKDNWDLSVARATSIVRILTDEYKMQPTRLTASGKGEFSPRAANDTPAGRASNRRTEIILSPKLDEIMNLLNY
jgi:chemotaxis protein MotB